MTTPSRLGDYLRARRELVQPEDAGLGVGDGRRRVSGLRRAEVAILAGISTEYYLRLEQGRDQNPSDQVLDALARALRLDAVATAYLHDLARPANARYQPSALGEVVHPQTQWLIDSWPMTAAVVHNRYIDVLASNALARAVNPNFRRGSNNVIDLLVDPAERALHRGWEGLTARSVALLRTMTGQQASDARLQELIGELTTQSSRFRELWARNDVVLVSEGVHILDHPHVGELVLHFTRLPLVGTDGQTIFLYTAEPGSPTARALAALAATI